MKATKMKAIKMKAANKIFILFITIFQMSLLYSQTLQDFKKRYEDYYTSKLYKVSPNHEWGLINNESDSHGYFIDLINFRTNKQERLPDGLKYHFLDELQLLIQKKDEKLVFKNLRTFVEKEIDNVAACEVRDREKVVLTINKTRDHIRFLNFNGDLIWEKKGLYYLDIKFIDSRIFFASDQYWGTYDFSTKKEISILTNEKVKWISVFDKTLIGLVKNEIDMSFLLYNTTTLKSYYLNLPKPPHLEFSAKLINQMEIRNNQFLILPLGVQDYRKKELADIYYTNSNSEARYSKNQLGIFDIKNKNWKWLPDYKNPYAVQRFVSTNGNFIQYNPYTDIVDSLNNPKTRIEFIRNFGEEKHTLKNEYYLDNNFYYDEATDNFLFFENLSWWCENLNNKSISKISLDSDIKQARDKNGSLDDIPAGAIYPTTKKGLFIVQTQGDLYYWNIINNKTTAITRGYHNGLEYKLSVHSLFPSLETSRWNTQTKEKVDVSKPYLILVNNKKTYETSIEKVFGSQRTGIVRERETIQKVFDGPDIIYTTSSVNEPLEVYQVSKGVKNLLYKSKGSFTKPRPRIKREHIHFNANGKELNAFLYYPLDYNHEQKYPMIVKVYEKETEQYRKDILPSLKDEIGFNIMHYVYNGYFVLIPDLDIGINDGQNAMINSVNSIMTKVTANSLINRDRVGVIGYSFGGYNAGLMIGKTNWFVTAVLGGSVSDIVRKSLTVNHISNTFKPDFYRVERQQTRMNSHLFENWDGYLKASPIYYLPQIKQPIMLWGGNEDTNVLPDQVQAYFLGLKRLQNKGVYLNYPNEGHGFSSPKNIEDVSYKIWQWFEYTLNGKRAADWITPLEK